MAMKLVNCQKDLLMETVRDSVTANPAPAMGWRLAQGMARLDLAMGLLRAWARACLWRGMENLVLVTGWRLALGMGSLHRIATDFRI